MTALRELWQARDLAAILVWRELVVRYKRSALGIAWALAEPLILVVVYVLVFGVVLDAQRGLSNYVLFALTGTLAWTFFSSTLEQCTNSMLEHAPLIKKTYFPRELLVVAVVLARFATLLAGIAIALAAFVVAGQLGSPIAWSRLWTVPIGIAAVVAMTFGLGLVTSAVQVILRDVAFLVRFLLRLAFYACPVVYPLFLVPEAVRPVYELNPLVATLWLFQAPTNPELAPPSALAFASTAFAAAVVPVVGWAAFRRLQWQVADLL